MINLPTRGNNQWVKRGSRIKRGTFILRLTSMIDVFTILLVFLLKSFSTEGEVMGIAPDLKLPVSSAEDPPRTTSIVVVTPEWLILDGKPIEKVQNVLKSNRLLITPLFQELKTRRVLAENIARMDEKMAFRGEITIQGDKVIPFEVLKKVMYTCGQVGYNNMLLAVTKESEL